MQTKLVSSLAGAALALGLLAQSGVASALGCIKQEALGLTQINQVKSRGCQDLSALGTAKLINIVASAKAYTITSKISQAAVFSGRMRLLTSGGSTLGCEVLDQSIADGAKSLNCSFPNATPAVTFLFTAGDAVGP